MKLLLLTVVLLAYCEVCADQNQHAASAEIQVVGERIDFRGLITEETTARVLQLYAASKVKPAIFRIESNGGASRAAIELGSFIFDVQLDVEVDTFCHSACANYVFTAGRRKALSQKASLVWHGGATQPVTSREIEQLLNNTLSKMDTDTRTKILEGRTRQDLLAQMHRSLTELIDIETRFFEKIGVDQRITTLGFLINPPPLAEGWYIGWDYSLEDMAALGVRDLTIKDAANWDPALPWPPAHIYRVKLSEVPGFHPQPSEVP